LSIVLWSLLPLAFCLFSCRINYSMSGKSASDLKTTTIRFFPINAPLAKPTVGQIFTEALRDIMTSQGKLDLVSSGADIIFEGNISGYQTNPVVIQSSDLPAQNRLTISIQVKVTYPKTPTKNFETSFSRFADYNSSLSLASVEDQLIKDIVDQLVQDVFNKTMQDW
jgi:hypothetical protein